MSKTKFDKPSAVRRCIARQDGQWLVLTQDGRSSVSVTELPEGARVLVRDGKAERQGL